MSWTATLKAPTRAADLTADSFNFGPQQGHAEDESREQFENAVTAVRALVQGGAWGDETRSFNVTLSGHANPRHKPADGWANDAVSVSVSQA